MLLQLATTRFEETLKERIPELRTAKDIDIRETQVILPGSPPPRGIITVSKSTIHYTPPKLSHDYYVQQLTQKLL